MTPEKPKISRVYVTVVDATTRKSKSTTFYNADPCDPAKVIDLLKRAFHKQKNKQELEPSAA